MSAMIPLGRAGTADETAGTAAMLAYPEADYVNGQITVCGGGFEA
jgi:3-oxoacyl-[acyl-carrier protein] reductase